MKKHIYIYADGSDLHDTWQQMKERILGFSNNQKVRFIDDRLPRDDSMEEDDLPDWNFGINFDLNDLSDEELNEWFFFFQNLGSSFGRDFAVGYYEEKSGISEDFGYIQREKSYDKLFEVVSYYRMK